MNALMNQLESERSIGGGLESEGQYSIANSTYNSVGGCGSFESGGGDLFESIDEIQNHGVGAADIQKLKQAGICTIKGIEFCTS